MKYFLSLALIACYILGISQSRELSGLVVDKSTQKRLPFASLGIESKGIGTICGHNGSFTFNTPGNAKSDTLTIRHIGYESFRIPIEAIPDSVIIELVPETVQLEEITVSSLTPEDYVFRISRNIEKNYPTGSYSTLLYYKAQLQENGNFLLNEEATIKSQYLYEPDTAGISHQILLCNEKEISYESPYVQAELQNKGKPITVNFGGPNAVLSNDVKYMRLAFLDTTKTELFTYSFGKATTYMGEPAFEITYKSAGEIDNSRMYGTILIMSRTYAVVKIDNYSTLNIPFGAVSILRVLGLTLKNPTMHQTIRYDKCGELWYPKYFEFKAKAILIKHHLFKDDELFTDELVHMAVINKIELDSSQNILPEHTYNAQKKMSEQVFNTESVSWDVINKL